MHALLLIYFFGVTSHGWGLCKMFIFDFVIQFVLLCVGACTAGGSWPLQWSAGSNFGLHYLLLYILWNIRNGQGYIFIHHQLPKNTDPSSCSCCGKHHIISHSGTQGSYQAANASRDGWVCRWSLHSDYSDWRSGRAIYRIFSCTFAKFAFKHHQLFHFCK